MYLTKNLILVGSPYSFVKGLLFGLFTASIGLLVMWVSHPLVLSTDPLLIPILVFLTTLVRAGSFSSVVSVSSLIALQVVIFGIQTDGVFKVVAVTCIVFLGIVLRMTYDKALETNKTLEQAVKIRDEFVSIAAHELRNPLNVLRLQASTFSRKHNLPSNDIDRINRQVTRLDDLVNSLLDVARISDGTLDHRPQEFDIKEMVSDILENFKQDLQLRGCKVSLSLPANELVGSWDRLRLEQVITNLITNASKYAPGEIFVSIDGDDRVVRLVVRDVGPGIAPEKLSVIFKKFGRANSDAKVSGLGLGLWVVKQIVEKHQGTIRVESELGKGTSFLVVLPRNKH